MSSLLTLIFKPLPLNKNKILFLNFKGLGYGDNPKYIAEYLRTHKPELDLVWMAMDVDEEYPSGIRTVKYGSLKAMYEQATAKIWVVNVRQFIRLRKKEGQYYIQTWHGPAGFKKVEKKAEDKLSLQYIKEAKYDGKVTDLMLSNSAEQTREMQSMFWYEGEILEAGLPRNDILFFKEDTNVKIAKIKEKIGVNQDEKLILYAPTFRKENTMEWRIRDMNKIYLAGCEYFGCECKILVRLHPNSIGQTIPYDDNVIDVTYYPDMQELLMISDFLISDYSSSILDFQLLNRPIIRFVCDIDSYCIERGLEELYFLLPYPLIKDEKNLYEAITQYDTYFSQDKLKKFLEYYNPFDKGKSSETVGKRIIDIIES